MSEKKNLLKSILAAQKEIGNIDKDATDKFHHYDYASAANVSTQTRKIFHSFGLILTSSMLDCTTQLLEKTKTDSKTGEVTISQSVLATVKIKYTLTETVTGESEEYIFYGLGYDANDKAVNKAITAAGKYAVLQILQLATGDDPEGSDPKKKKSTRTAPSTAKTAPSTAKTAPSGDWDGTAEIKFGKFKGQTYADMEDDYLIWVIEKSSLAKYTKDDCQRELDRRQAPDSPTTMADDDAPMTEKEIKEMVRLFTANYSLSYWEDFLETNPNDITFGIFKKFKRLLEGADEAGADAGAIGERLDEFMKGLG